MYDGQEARTITTDEGPARVGVIGPGALVGILGDEGAQRPDRVPRCVPVRAALAGLLGRIVALPDDEYDAIAARFDQARGDAAMAAAAAAGPVVAEVTVDGSRLALATGVMAGGGLCSTVVWSAGGQYPLDPATRSGAVGPPACRRPPRCNPLRHRFQRGKLSPLPCAGRGPANDPSVQVLDASGAAHSGVVVGVAPDRNVGLVAPLVILVVGLTSDENGAMQPILSGGPITVQWLDATGAVAAFEVVGASGGLARELPEGGDDVAFGVALVDAEIGEGTLVTLVLEEGEEEVLGADVVVAEAERLAERELEHLLGVVVVGDEGGGILDGGRQRRPRRGCRRSRHRIRRSPWRRSRRAR